MANLPRRFGSYMLLQRLARGGMGEIYLGQKPRGHGTRYVALKTLRQDLTRDKEYVQRFLDEARVAIILKHPAINKVFDVGFAEDTFFLELEYISGRDVRALLDRARDLEHRVPPVVAYHIVDHLLDALAYLHEAKDLSGSRLNLIHRDVSPQNVMTSWKGEVTLIDFGLARFAARSTATEPGMVMGKLRYMAPEQACGHDIDQRVDIFAAGVVLYELLSGRRLYENVDASQLWQVVAAGRALDGVAWDAVPPGTIAMIRRALAIKRDERYPSAKAFLTDLRTIAGEARNRYCEPLAKLLSDLYEVDLKLEREFMDKLGRLAPFELSGDEVTHSVSLADPGASVPEETQSGSAFVGDGAAAPTTEMPLAPAPVAAGGRNKPETPADISSGYGYLEAMLTSSGRRSAPAQRAPTASAPASEASGEWAGPTDGGGPPSGEWAGPTDGDGATRVSEAPQPPLQPTEATVAAILSRSAPVATRAVASGESTKRTAAHSLQDEQTLLLGKASDALGELTADDAEAAPLSVRSRLPWVLAGSVAIGALVIGGALWLRQRPSSAAADMGLVAVVALDGALAAVTDIDAGTAPAARRDAALTAAPAARPNIDPHEDPRRPVKRVDRKLRGKERVVSTAGKPPESPPPPLPEPVVNVARVEPPVEKINYLNEARSLLRTRGLVLDDAYGLWPEVRKLKNDIAGDDEKRRILAALESDVAGFSFSKDFLDSKLRRVQSSYSSIRPRLDQRSSMFRDLEEQNRRMLEAFSATGSDPGKLAAVNKMINEMDLAVRLASR